MKMIEVRFKGYVFKIRKDVLLCILKVLKSDKAVNIEQEFEKVIAKEEKINQQGTNESTIMLDFLKQHGLNDVEFLKTIEKISAKAK